MAKIDETFSKYSNFKGYVGNAPSTETEYDAMKANSFSGTPPTWSDIQAQMYDINRKFEYPSIQDQLDKIYHDFNGWKNDIETIKNKYPKSITGGTSIGAVPDWIQTEVDNLNS